MRDHRGAAKRPLRRSRHWGRAPLGDPNGSARAARIKSGELRGPLRIEIRHRRLRPPGHLFQGLEKASDSRAALHRGPRSAGLARGRALCFPVPACSIPRILAKRRDEIVESCRRAARRGRRRRRDRALTSGSPRPRPSSTRPNRRRNEHQAVGQAQARARRARGARRRGAAAEGRGRARSRPRLAQAQRRSRRAMAADPELRPPRDARRRRGRRRELRRVGDAAPASTSRRAITSSSAKRLALVDFEAGAKVAGQKFYFLKNEAVLLELALQRFALEIADRATASRRSSRPTSRASSVLDGARLQPARAGDADLLDREHRPLPDRHGRDHARRAARGRAPRRGRPADATRGPVALLPHRGGRGRAARAGALPRAPVHEGRDVRVHAARGLRGDARRDPRASRRRSSRRSGSLPRDRHRHGRPRRPGLPQVRPRGLDAGPRRRRASTAR